jgi:transcriptional regulator with XRE-family HTH domain
VLHARPLPGSKIGRPASRAVLTCLADALQLEPTVLASPPPTTPDNACDGVQDAATTVTDRVQPAPSLSAPISAVHLRRCRTQANLTQPQLARRAGVARETIARIENGRPARRAVFFRLAEALRVAPSMLTGSAELDALTGETYRTCKCCAALRPLAGFIPVKGTPYVYLRCRECRARDAKERYYRTPEIHEAEKRRRAKMAARRHYQRLRYSATGSYAAAASVREPCSAVSRPIPALQRSQLRCMNRWIRSFNQEVIVPVTWWSGVVPNSGYETARTLIKNVRAAWLGALFGCPALSLVQPGGCQRGHS